MPLVLVRKRRGGGGWGGGERGADREEEKGSRPVQRGPRRRCYRGPGPGSQLRGCASGPQSPPLQNGAPGDNKINIIYQNRRGLWAWSSDLNLQI